MGIRVRALERGFYDGTLREPGTEFEVESKAEVGRWMEVLGKGKDKPAQPAQPESDQPLA